MSGPRQSVVGIAPVGKVCDNCGKRATGSVIFAGDKTFHENCWCCTGPCGKPLQNAYYEYNGMPMCSICYGNLHRPKCVVCGDAVLTGGLVALNKDYHQSCFCCIKCNIPLPGTFYPYNENPYCKDCYLITKPTGFVCAGCGENIIGEMVKAMGQVYHPNHFACTTCGEPFTDQFYTHEGLPYCKSCTPNRPEGESPRPPRRGGRASQRPQSISQKDGFSAPPFSSDPRSTHHRDSLPAGGKVYSTYGGLWKNKGEVKLPQIGPPAGWKAGAPSSQRNPDVDPNHLSNWEEWEDDEGYLYYFNKVTQESRWDPPPGWMVKTEEFQNPGNYGKTFPAGKRALLIGVDYGNQHNLKGCCNDARNLSEFLSDYWGFSMDQMVILTDDQPNPGKKPTKERIIKSLNWLIENAVEGESLFFAFSGLGSRMDDSDEECILPVDYKRNGSVVDRDLFETLSRLPPGVHLTGIIDAYGSDCALHLPFVLTPGSQQFQQQNNNYLDSDVVFFTSYDNSTHRYSMSTGAMCSSFMNCLKKNPSQTYKDLIKNLRDEMNREFSQQPMISSSKYVDLTSHFEM